MKRSIGIGLISGVGGGLLLLPLWGGSFSLSLVEVILIQGIAAWGLHFVVGEAGMISLGQAGLMAAGAFGMTLLMKAGMPSPFALLLAGMIGGGCGWLMALPAHRLEGPYLAIATLAFGQLIVLVIASVPGWGGKTGLPVPAYSGSPQAQYYLVLLFAGLLWAWAHYLKRSRLGQVWRAIRDDQLVAESIGIAVSRYKQIAFTLGGLYAGFAGGLWAGYLGYLSPDLFGFQWSVMLLAGVVLGGLGRVNGVILGTALLVGTDHFLSPNGQGSWSWILGGLVLIIGMLWRPLQTQKQKI